MCIYNFLYMIIYSYVYTLVNHKCIVNWIGSLNALNSKLVVFVTLVIMYLLAQWCASSKPSRINKLLVFVPLHLDLHKVL